MKKVLCFLFFAANISAQAQTSVYHPFPDSNAVWGVYVTCWQWNCGKWANYRYEYGQDTIIGAYSYTRVIQSMINNGGSTCSCFPWSEPGGYLRQDTSAKKVFWISEQNLSIEYLLYDFGLSVGDTMSGYPLQWCPLVVESIDSILIGTSYRKKINFAADQCDHYSIIEGIGGANGLANSLCFFMDYGASLTCFSENGNVVHNTSVSCQGYNAISCDSVVSTDSSFPIENKFILSPNPATTSFTIYPEYSGRFTISEIEIYNTLGEKVYSKQQTTNDKQQTVDISQLLPGVYFVAVTPACQRGGLRAAGRDDKGNKITRKFIKL